MNRTLAFLEPGFAHLVALRTNALSAVWLVARPAMSMIISNTVSVMVESPSEMMYFPAKQIRAFSESYRGSCAPATQQGLHCLYWPRNEPLVSV